jgi:hypothetical protein
LLISLFVIKAMPFKHTEGGVSGGSRNIYPKNAKMINRPFLLRICAEIFQLWGERASKPHQGPKTRVAPGLEWCGKPP